jgi:hypothetical protein
MTASPAWRRDSPSPGSSTRQTRHARAEQEVRDALGEERYLTLRHQGGGYALADIVQFAAEGADELPPPGGVAAASGGGAGRGGGRAWRGGRTCGGGRGAHRPRVGDCRAGRRGIVQPGDRRALVISKRTVDAHIEHIYGKIGVSSRVQLASWLRTWPPE